MATRMSTLVLVFAALLMPAAAQEATPPADPLSGMSPTEAVEHARELWESGTLAEALDLATKALEREPAHTAGNVLAGEILLETGDYNLARDYFKRALAVEPSNFLANLGYGRILLANRSHRQATAFLQVAEGVAPDDKRSEVKRFLAFALTGMGKITEGIAKAQEAVSAAPDDLDALETLVIVLQTAVNRDPRQIEPALEAATALATAASNEATDSPWDMSKLQRLDTAFKTRLTLLEAYHRSFYVRNFRDEATDELQPEKGPEAAAALITMAELHRRWAMLQLILAEHQALYFLETATREGYDPNNVEYLHTLAAAYQQVQALTVRLLGPAVAQDTKLADKVANTCRKILAVDPSNQPAREYLESAGQPLSNEQSSSDPPPDSE